MSMKKTLWNLNKIKLFSYFDQNTLYIIIIFFLGMIIFILSMHPVRRHNTN